MPIHTANAPQESIKAVQNILQGWADRPNETPMAMRAMNFTSENGVHVSLPHPVYEISLADVAAGKGLDAAHQVSWRYLVSDGSLTASAETVAKGGTHEFSMLNRGPFVQSLVSTVAAAGNDQATAKADYEVAVLNIPGLYLVALWLRAWARSGDILIPLAPAPASLQAGQKYTGADLLKALAPAAAEVLKRAGDHRSN